MLPLHDRKHKILTSASNSDRHVHAEMSCRKFLNIINGLNCLLIVAYRKTQNDIPELNSGAPRGRLWSNVNNGDSNIPHVCPRAVIIKGCRNAKKTAERKKCPGKNEIHEDPCDDDHKTLPRGARNKTIRTTRSLALLPKDPHESAYGEQIEGIENPLFANTKKTGRKPEPELLHLYLELSRHPKMAPFMNEDQ